MWNCLPSPLLPVLCLSGGPWSGWAQSAMGTDTLADQSQSFAVDTVSFSVNPGLFIYFTWNEKPLFLIKNVLSILLGPDFVHSCLGASKTFKKKNLIRAFAARETEGGNWPPTRILVGALSFKCKKMFPWLSNGVANSRSSSVVSLVWKNDLYQEMAQGWWQVQNIGLSLEVLTCPSNCSQGQQGLRCRLVPEQFAPPAPTPPFFSELPWPTPQPSPIS